MTHPETAYRFYREAFDFDMTSSGAGYSAHEACDTYMKALISSQESFSPEHGTRYFLSSVDGLYILQKEAEQYGLILSYNACRGLFSLETRFGPPYWYRVVIKSGITLEEAMLFSDTVEEIKSKVSLLLPPDWEARIKAAGGFLDKMNDFSENPLTVLDFIERQIINGIPRDVVIARTAGLLAMRADIVFELYDHIKTSGEE